MTDQEFLDRMNAGEEVEAGSDLHRCMHALSQKALRLTHEMNDRYRTPEELSSLMQELTGEKSEGLGLFPPFYTDCGRNIHFGKNVFINAGCKFQDQGGIYIGDNALIGHNAVLATLNHNQDPSRRGNVIPSPIVIGKNVWIGANATILPGTTIEDGAIIAAGAVVSGHVEKNSVYGGVPAKRIKSVEERPDEK